MNEMCENSFFSCNLQAYCLFEGANLVSIHSYDENHLIQALTKGDTHNFPETWIGGHDAIHVCKSVGLVDIIT